MSAGDSQRIGEITSLENDVRHKVRKGFQWRSLRRPRDLSWGDGVFTGKGSKARVRLDDGSEIDLQENSLVIFTPSQDDLVLNLQYGNFTGTLSSDGRLRVNNNGEIVDLMGDNAQIMIGRNDAGNLSVQVLNGEVTALDKNGQRSLAAGSQAALENGALKERQQRQPASKAMWKTGEMTKEAVIPVDIDAHPVAPAKAKLKWESPGKKEKYQLQVAKDPEFKEIVEERTVTGSVSEFKTTEPGSYFVRLKPEKGDEKTWSDTEEIKIKKGHPMGLDAPVLSRKTFVVDGVEHSEARLTWKKVPQAKEYAVEISHQEDFSEIVRTEITKENSFTLSDFPREGAYARVRAVTPGGRHGFASDTATVRVTPSGLAIDPIPEIRILGKTPFAPPEPVDLKVKWNQLGIAKAYELQFDKDPEFKEPLKFKTKETSGTLKVRDPGDYHVRVRPLDARGAPLGNFSEAQKMSYVYRIPLATPVAVEPLNNITMFFQTTDAPFYFVWKPVQQAEWYWLELAVDPEFQNKILSEKVTKTRYLYRPTAKVGRLYWRLKAQNTERESHWSEARSIKLFSGRRAQE